MASERRSYIYVIKRQCFSLITTVRWCVGSSDQPSVHCVQVLLLLDDHIYVVFVYKGLDGSFTAPCAFYIQLCLHLWIRGMPHFRPRCSHARFFSCPRVTHGLHGLLTSQFCHHSLSVAILKDSRAFSLSAFGLESTIEYTFHIIGKIWFNNGRTM